MSRSNPAPSVVREEWQVDQGLREIGLTREFVRAVAFAASGARNEALKIDPAPTAGLLSYIHGVRAIRMGLLPLGWRIARNGNVESTVNDVLGIQLCFQNVVEACGDDDPQAVSGKGSASRELINSGQTDMFNSAPTSSPLGKTGKVPTVWVLCVSSHDNHVCAEVSCPESFEGDQYEGFKPRLCVIDETLDPTPNRGHDSGDDDLDLDISVTKK